MGVYSEGGGRRDFGAVLSPAPFPPLTGWLEPLLDEIHKDKTTVVTPVIDVIDDSTLQFHYGSAKHTSVGGFDWNLQFNWHGIPDHENKRRKTEVSIQSALKSVCSEILSTQKHFVRNPSAQ